MNNIISCIMPVYNGEEYLSRSIDSFLNQKYSKKELIIVGNKSSDNSNKIIKKYINKYPNYIKWLDIADKGISNAYNVALNVAKGQYICYLGADDILCGGIFEKIVDFIDLNFKVDIFYFDSYNFLVKKNKFILRSCATELFKVPLTKNNLLNYGSIVALQNIVFSKEILKDNHLDEENKYSMDYELLLRLFTKYKDKLMVLPIKLPFSVNLQHENISQSKRFEQHKEAVSVAIYYSSTIYQKLLSMFFCFKMKICELLIILKIYD